MLSNAAKQEKIQKNFRKAQQLRQAREAKEQSDEKRRVARLEAENDNLRHRSRSVAIEAPSDYMKHLIDKSAAHAAREMHRPIADMFGSPPWSAAIGRVSEDIFNGAWPFARIQQQGAIEMRWMEELFSQNYRFSLHIPAVDVSYIIDEYELKMARRW